MKKLLTVTFLFLFLFPACKKEETNITLKSTWLKLEDGHPIDMRMEITEVNGNKDVLATGIAFAGANVPYLSEVDLVLDNGKDYNLQFKELNTEHTTAPLVMEAELFQFDLLSRPDTLILVDLIKSKNVYLLLAYE